jgi:tetratricopeptide (TPR) repeat protein
MLALPQISPFRHVLNVIALSLFAVSVIASSPFTVRAQNDPERDRAFQLYKDTKYVEALPLFEKLAVAHPQDRAVIETLGLLVYSQSAFLKTPAERKQARKRGREILLQAQNLGSNSPLLLALLQGIPEDGGNDESFSPQKEVNEAMKEGEAAFAKGEFSTALEMYQRALLLDPKLYEAALFIGDVYFKTADQAKAGEWFARATAINPDRETAYRYWGDSLIKQGRLTQAGEKFVEAYIAEPYSRLARAGLLNWGEKANVTLGHPKVDIPTSVTPQQNGNQTINIDPNALKNDDKSGSGAAWVTYGLVRASWSSGEFAKQYPNEKTYRHSLKEEAAAMRAALKVLSETKNSDTARIDASLKILAKLDKDGLLEAFILLALPDKGIAEDYAAYRVNNVEKLRRYVVDYVLTGGVGKNQ